MVGFFINIFMEQKKKLPVESHYYSGAELTKLVCGPLPPERDRTRRLENAIVRGNPVIDGKNIKGYN